MSQLKETQYHIFVYQTPRCLHEENEMENEVEMYIYIYRSYQNLSCIGWAKTDSIWIILKLSSKTKLYLKL